MVIIETYSYSKIKCYLSCKKSYYERYYEKPEKERPELSVGHGTSEFGTFVHSILEKYEKNELSIDELLDYYKNNYNENIQSSFVLRLSEKFSKDFSQSYYESGEKYFSDFEGFKDFNILEAEYSFEVPVKDVCLFNGKIDLIARDNDGSLIIIDHKSKSSFKNKAEVKEYAIQLYLYAYAAYQKYKELPKYLMFNIFRKKEWEIIDFNMEDYNNAISWLITNVEEIESCFDFSVTPNTFFCNNFCSYRYANFEDCINGGKWV